MEITEKYYEYLLNTRPQSDIVEIHICRNYNEKLELIGLEAKPNGAGCGDVELSTAKSLVFDLSQAIMGCQDFNNKHITKVIWEN